MIASLLIANRGEIACRIIRTARSLGIRTIAVHSDADATALHVRLADEAVPIGPSPARESYLVGDRILAAARDTGAEAIHPGYGFLSENARFAEIVESHNIIWIGPKPEHIRTMGDKIEAKRTAAALGLPLVPGSRFRPLFAAGHAPLSDRPTTIVRLVERTAARARAGGVVAEPQVADLRAA